jgi:hypothetical protein
MMLFQIRFLHYQKLQQMHGYNRDIVNKVVSISINGESFRTPSYTDQMNIDFRDARMSLGRIEQVSSAFNQQSSIGNYSFFERP